MRTSASSQFGNSPNKARGVLFSDLFGEFRLRHARFENKFSVLGRNVDLSAGFDIAAQNFLGERIFKITLDRAAHRTRAIIWIVTLLDHELVRSAVENDFDFLRLQTCLHLLDFKIDNVEQIFLGQRMEDGDFVEAKSPSSIR